MSKITTCEALLAVSSELIESKHFSDEFKYGKDVRVGKLVLAD